MAVETPTVTRHPDLKEGGEVVEREFEWPLTIVGLGRLELRTHPDGSRAAYQMPKPAQPYGLCQCGCGAVVLPLTHTVGSRKKGEPGRCLNGHRTTINHSPVFYVEQCGCWRWARATAVGYGVLKIGGDKGRSERAHRLMYEALIGPIAYGLELDHLCDRPICCNPSHLEPVTHQENIRRAYHGRSA